MYEIMQSARDAVAAQCKRQNNRFGRKCDLCDQIVTDGLLSVFQKLMIIWDFHTTASTVYTEWCDDNNNNIIL